MIDRRSIPVRALCAVLMFLAACHDVPTAARPAAPVSLSSATGGPRSGEVFYCVRGRQAPEAAYGWRSWVDTLYFPRPEIGERGQRVQYRYRVASTDGKLIFGADCDVPYTEGAMRRLDRYFRVQSNGGADQYRARQEMVTLQGCVTDGICPLEPIIVAPPPVQPVTDPDDLCSRYPGECKSEGGGGDPAGGGDDSLSPYEQGPLTWVACIGAGLVAIGGGALSYVAIEQYYMAVSAYASAKLRYQYASTIPDQWRYHGEMLTAERNLNAMTVNLAGSAAVTVGGLLAVAALCSPTVLFPTP